MLPIYYDDLTDDEKENGKSVVLTATYDEQTDYYITVTPTDTWYAFNSSDQTFGNQGESVTFTLTPGSENSIVTTSDKDAPMDQFILLNLTIEQGGGQ